MDDNKPNKQFKVILIMGLLTAIGPLSIDMYLPAFPAIAKSLHTTVSEVTLSLSSFFIGISAGQLLYGPSARTLWQKTSIVCRTLFLLFSFRWLCFRPIGEWFNCVQALSGDWWLCGNGCSKGHGEGFVCCKRKCKSIFHADAGRVRISRSLHLRWEVI